MHDQEPPPRLSDSLSAERAYWLAKLGGELDKVGFTADHPEAGATPAPTATHDFVLDGALHDRIMKLSAGSPPKVFMVLAALVAALLHRYSARHDLVLAAPIHRQAQEGRFINTVVLLRSTIGPSTSFKQLLIDLRQTILEAVDHQNYPLSKLFHALGLPPVAEGSPLVDVALYLSDIHDPDYLTSSGARTTFGFTLEPEAITGRIHYDQRYFCRATLERIAAHLLRLANLALTDLDRPLSQLELISGQEKHDFFFNFPPPSPLPLPGTLHGLFSVQAAATPEAIALRIDDDSLSYAELNRRAHRLAHYLLSLGLAREEVVGLATQTNFDLITGIFAVLKAGGAYLPLDPNLPPQRLAEIIGDAGVRRVLSSRPWPEAQAMGLEVIDPSPPQLDPRLPDHEPLSPAGPENLAYVIYTSGSTGRPKGVMIEHRGIVNFALWRKAAFAFCPGEVTLQLVPESFDGFGSNLYPTLLGGATLVLVNEERWGDVAHIRHVLKSQGGTNCAVVPSMYRLLLEGAGSDELASLKMVTLAGEPTPAGLLRQSAALLPQTRLVNEYGPTEDSVASTAHFGLSAECPANIGRPIAGHFALVLDEDLRLKPIGEPGELCLAGIGLSRGYLNRPEETRARFVANPYADLCQGAARLYRSGDLARWLPDGNLELLGRLDEQVQVRGFRVEPREIENRLLSYPEVRQAAVVARQDDQGQTTLWAYLAAEGEVEAEDLRQHLLATLPDYMLPSVFLRAKALPLNRHGKLDRRALADLEATRLGAGEYEPPRNAVEETLARVWAEKLGLERVGIHDNYFNLGGDSVKAISLLAALNRELGCDVRIPALYEHKTVAELARQVTKSAGADQTVARAGARAVSEEMEALRQRILGR